VTYAFRRWRYKKAYAYELLEAADALDAIGERFRKSAHVDCTKLIPLLNVGITSRLSGRPSKFPRNFRRRLSSVRLRYRADEKGRRGSIYDVQPRSSEANPRFSPMIGPIGTVVPLRSLSASHQRLREAPLMGLI